MIQIKKGWRSIFTVILVIATGAFYELIEMWVTLSFHLNKGLRLWEPKVTKWVHNMMWNWLCIVRC
ncbi:DUF2238 domain-containing protein [Risungbinella massiliensis]|uniref:DUF2238 domain-containing protein n=1 Tax=Risungbinella massiliensis TaxID=1329796 RepID=UPI00164E6E9B